jgi:hypothetical protein
MSIKTDLVSEMEYHVVASSENSAISSFNRRISVILHSGETVYKTIEDLLESYTATHQTSASNECSFKTTIIRKILNNIP